MCNKIALIGLSKSGKDYLYQNVFKPLGYERLSFSDQLKKVAKNVFPWMKLDYSSEQKEKSLFLHTGFDLIEKSPRDIWIFFNQLKEIEPNIFVRMLDEEWKRKGFKKVVITDVRFRNEWDYCNMHGFLFIRIKSPGETIQYEIEKETDALPYDYVFFNEKKGEKSIKDFQTFLSERFII